MVASQCGQTEVTPTRGWRATNAIQVQLEGVQQTILESCDQMFLQQGFLSSVVCASLLLIDTALVGVRTTCLLLTFL